MYNIKKGGLQQYLKRENGTPRMAEHYAKREEDSRAPYSSYRAAIMNGSNDSRSYYD